MTHVVVRLTAMDISDAFYNAKKPVEELLSSINDPKVHERAGGQRCPADSHFAVVSAMESRQGAEVRWTAEGTRWPTSR